MPAYLKPMARVCNDPLCTKQATVELFNTHNAHLGYFCTKHGDERKARHNGEAP